MPTVHCVCVLSHSVMSYSVTLWTVARQAPLSMGFSRQAYWSGLPFSSPSPPRDPTHVFSVSPALQADSLPAVYYAGSKKTGKAMRSVKKKFAAMFVCNKNIKHKKDSNVK